eukprot:67040-Rhodomonas_salina.1
MTSFVGAPWQHHHRKLALRDATWKGECPTSALLSLPSTTPLSAPPHPPAQHLLLTLAASRHDLLIPFTLTSSPASPLLLLYAAPPCSYCAELLLYAATLFCYSVLLWCYQTWRRPWPTDMPAPHQSISAQSIHHPVCNPSAHHCLQSGAVQAARTHLKPNLVFDCLGLVSSLRCNTQTVARLGQGGGAGDPGARGDDGG